MCAFQLSASVSRNLGVVPLKYEAYRSRRNLHTFPSVPQTFRSSLPHSLMHPRGRELVPSIDPKSWPSQSRSTKCVPCQNTSTLVRTHQQRVAKILRTARGHKHGLRYPTTICSRVIPGIDNIPTLNTPVIKTARFSIYICDFLRTPNLFAAQEAISPRLRESESSRTKQLPVPLVQLLKNCLLNPGNNNILPFVSSDKPNVLVVDP